MMLTFKFFATEPEAREFCAGMDRRNKAHFTPWQSTSETDQMHFIAWYETTPQKVAYRQTPTAFATSGRRESMGGGRP